MVDLQKTDCLVVGAGPAGLTSAVYLGRYLRSVLVASHGRSRACLIPREIALAERSYGFRFAHLHQKSLEIAAIIIRHISVLDAAERYRFGACLR